MGKNKELFGNGPLPSVIENPFDVKSIESIHIYYGKYPISGGPYFTGKVQFKKGNTRGEQSFDGDNLSDVFIKVMNFCKELENNGK